MYPDISERASPAVVQADRNPHPAHHKRKKLQHSFERLERQKRYLLTQLSTWPEEERQFRPGPHSWSALDVIDHLVKVESESLALIQARLTERYTVTVRERMVARVVFAVMRSPLKVRVPPSVLSVLPGGCTEYDAIVAHWQEVRTKLQLVIDGLQAHQFTWGLFHHPVSGSMTILDALTFLSVHMTHHGYQLRRIRAAYRKRSD